MTEEEFLDKIAEMMRLHTLAVGQSLLPGRGQKEDRWSKIDDIQGELVAAAKRGLSKDVS